MDVEFVTEGDENFLVNENINENNADYTNIEGERCGICMDIVIDRGVLDCCQHWFCFTCIDNWATITNLCPLCQIEFQLITCVPVYDTIGSNKNDEDLYSRDDDWSIEGQNNTVSFPSYYIDESAVVCLEGDGCKIRNRSVTSEADSVLDTSIACDGCDVWYHAFCVGFDPEGTCENSWHCPRCLLAQMAQNSADDVPISRLDSQLVPGIGSDYSGEASFPGKLSVTIADDGETAIVVSLVDGNQGSLEPDGRLPSLDLISNKNVDTHLLSSMSDDAYPGQPPSPIVCSKLNSGSEELELSLSQNTGFSLAFPSTSFAANKVTEEPRFSSELGISLAKSSSELLDDKLLKSGLNLHLGLTVNSSSPVDLIDNMLEDDQVPGLLNKKGSLQQVSPDDKIIPDRAGIISVGSGPDIQDTALVTGAKRKHKDSRIPDGGEGKSEIDAEVSLKKVKVEALEGNNQLVSLEEYSSVSDEEKLLTTTTIENSLNEVSYDIRNIVQDTGRRRNKQAAHTGKERENAARLRVKKILRRTGDADSSLQVQELRKQIREAVRNKSSKEIGESIFDPKLLAAFRAVVAGPVTDSKKSPLDLKAKKALLQKGKVREHLTKKIYGVGGRRKRAWTRDCEVEFWKHRCSKISRPEKVQTLKSVLDLLRNDTSNKDIKHGKDREPSSILSRLYLADTSIFPRKDDIRPVSALGDYVIPEKNKEQNLPQNIDKNSLKDEGSKKMAVTPTLESKRPKKDVSGLKTEAASEKCQAKHAERPFTSQLGGSKLSSQKEIPAVSDGMKNDKRKWALQLLARKTATNGPKEKQEDSVLLKGNYPLLAQLPKDMRPVLAPVRHNKIPASIRQAQLYRLAEHFLRKANLPVIHLTAETELAVADAVNIEKEVANRSNSKLVYVNLCSQELSRRSDNINLGREGLIQTSVVSTDEPEENNDATSQLEVNEALKLAGLSDTPPSSPCQPVEDDEDAGLLEKNEDDGPDNVFEMDSQPELDIYGDFEYNLEDDDFIDCNAVKTSEPLAEGSRMKLLLSTLNLEKSNGSPGISDLEGSACIKPILSSSGHEFPPETGILNRNRSANDDKMQTKIGDEEHSELSLAECEELYGPDKGPLVLKYPETATIQPCELIDGKDTEFGNGCNGFHEAASSTGFLEASKAQQGASGSANSASQNAEQRHHSKEKSSAANSEKQADIHNSVSKKISAQVEAYVKEHIRPLCKSGVITVEQYRWAVGKTTEKVMKFHSKEKNANFLIKEGERVKKLAERYAESAQQTAKTQ